MPKNVCSFPATRSEIQIILQREKISRVRGLEFVEIAFNLQIFVCILHKIESNQPVLLRFHSRGALSEALLLKFARSLHPLSLTPHFQLGAHFIMTPTTNQFRDLLLHYIHICNCNISSTLFAVQFNSKQRKVIKECLLRLYSLINIMHFGT